MMAEEKQFNPRHYTDSYYRKHFEKYRSWENAIGRHIVERFAPKSIVDLGCGVGSVLEGAFLAGCRDLLGIEMFYAEASKYLVEAVRPYVGYGDVTCDLHLDRKFDCCMSFEVAEHLPANSSSSFVDNLINCSNRHIILTAAPPGQSGTGHINCREKRFWVTLIEDKGFQLQEEFAKEIRTVWKSFGAPRYVIHNLMIFLKRKI